MIVTCDKADMNSIYQIINDAAIAYKGVIPADRWHEPYMSSDQLNNEIESGVQFWGWKEDSVLQGIMGIQQVQDVSLIRHAYVRTGMRNKGIGTKLLMYLMKKTDRPVLIGTWKDAVWAIEFYKKNGFSLVSEEEKNVLLKKYWSIPDRQVETSVVLADNIWRSDMKKISVNPADKRVKR